MFVIRVTIRHQRKGVLVYGADTCFYDGYAHHGYHCWGVFPYAPVFPVVVDGLREQISPLNQAGWGDRFFGSGVCPKIKPIDIK